MRKLASIRLIKDIQPISEADLVVKATIDGWEVVVKKDDFKIGDKCVYIEIDSVVDRNNPAFEFLMKRKRIIARLPSRLFYHLCKVLLTLVSIMCPLN